jgi:predicted O-methyltransferase YrrM
MLYQINQFLQFYAKAVTRYQIHSPFVFDLVQAVLEDDRYYYAYRDVEAIRAAMLHSDALLQVTDYGAGGQYGRHSTRPLRQIAANAASRPRQGRMLFRLIQHFRPDKILELGASVGVSTMYIAAAARQARLIALEGCPQTAAVCRTNLDALGLTNADIQTGAFDTTLTPALQQLDQVDWVFFDGDHRPEPTLRYFETCLGHAHGQTVFVFDDVYWSPGMTRAWEVVQNHPGVRLTVDFFDLSLAFIRPEFRGKQHICVIPAQWKPGAKFITK